MAESKFEFTGSDDQVYSFFISSMKNETIDAVQFERLKRIAKSHKFYSESDENDKIDELFEFTDLFWDFVFHDFKKVYPKHWIVEDKEAYNSRKGLTAKGYIWFAEFITANTTLLELLKAIFPEPENTENENIRPNSTETIESRNTETISNSDKQRSVKTGKTKSAD